MSLHPNEPTTQMHQQDPAPRQRCQQAVTTSGNKFKPHLYFPVSSSCLSLGPLPRDTKGEQKGRWEHASSVIIKATTALCFNGLWNPGPRGAGPTELSDPLGEGQEAFTRSFLHRLF